MLATRLATAAVLIPLIVAGIVLLPTGAVAVIFAIVVGIGAWEWARLLGWAGTAPRAVYTACYIVLTIGFGWYGYASTDLGLVPAVLVDVACVWWVAVTYWLVRFPTGWGASIGRPVIGAIVGLLVLCAAATAVPAIHSMAQGLGLLLIFFVLVWGSDTGAYFAGRTLGRRRLAPAISPGKTLEGAVGGIIAALVVATLSAYLLGYSGARFAGFIVLGAWVAVISIFGDLTLSMFKRHAGIKDTGTLFPGHGGVLDRLDSILAAAPWFVFGLTLLPHG